MADESVVSTFATLEGKEEDDETLVKFLKWCEVNKLVLNKKVKIGVKGSCHRYGMVACEDIAKHECLFQVPRNLLLEPRNCHIFKILDGKGKKKLLDSQKCSSWVPLLLSLMYEYTSPTSFWRPYLDIIPSISILDQPMFWQNEDRNRLLKGIGIEEDVEGDLARIEDQYRTVLVPFIERNSTFLSPSIHSLELYKHMAAFVMAYSFTEDSPGCDGNNAPVMVPMADILNHHSNNNARLEFGEEELRMVSTQPILKGQEVFNTYGQLANCHLLQSYGFVESTPNPFDTVEAPLSLFYKVTRRNAGSKREARILDAKFQFMEEMGLVSSEDVFVFGRDGSYQHGPALHLFFKVLHLGEDQLRELLLQPNEDSHRFQEELSDLNDLINQCSDEQKDSSLRVLERVLKLKDRSPKKTKLESNNMDVKERREGGTTKRKMKCDHPESADKKNKLGIVETGVKRDISMSLASDKGDHSIVKDIKDNHENARIKDSDTKNGNKMDLNVIDSEQWDSNDSENSGCADGMTSSDDEEDEEEDEEEGDDDEVDAAAADDADDESGVENEAETDSESDSEEVNEEETDDQGLSYEQMMEFLEEWKWTLKRVAEECRSLQLELWESNNLDKIDPKDLSRREWSVQQIRRGQQAIWQQICHLIMDE